MKMARLVCRGLVVAALILQACFAASASSDETAREWYERETQLDKELLDLFNTGRDADAIALLAKSTGSRPDRLNARAALKLRNLSADLTSTATLERLLRLQMTLWSGDGHEQSLRADATLQLANLTHDQNRLEEAETLYRRALAIYESEPEKVAAVGAMEARHDLADLLVRMSRPSEAESLYRRNFSLAGDSPDLSDGRFQHTLSSLCNLLLDIGNVGEADRISAAATEQASRNLALTPEDRVNLLLTRANVLGRTGRDDEAAVLLREAKALLPPREVATAQKPVPNIDAHYSFHFAVDTQLAAHAARAGRIAEAEGLLRSHVDRLVLESPPELAGLSSLTIAAYALEAGSQLGAILSEHGEDGKATAVFDVLSPVARQSFGPNSLQAAKLAEAGAIHHLRYGRSEAARRLARDALAIWITLDAGIGRSVDDVALLERTRAQRSAAWLLARTSAQADQPEDAAELFAALQRAEITAASAALARKAADNAALAQGAAKEFATWQAAKTDLATINAEIAALAKRGSGGDAQRLLLQRRREDMTPRLRVAEDDLERRAPAFFDLVSPRPVPLGAFIGPGSLLRADEALIVLAPGSQALPERARAGVVFVVTREGAVHADLGLDAETLSGEITALHQALAEPGAGATDAPGLAKPEVRFSRARAHRLYAALFADPQIAARLAPKTRWTLAPQGSLLALPFAALVTAPPPGGEAGDADPDRLRETRWLGHERALALTPSVGSLLLQRRRAPPETVTRAPFLGFGDPAFRGVPDEPATGPLVRSRAALPGAPVLDSTRRFVRSGVADPAALGALPRLPASGMEIQSLASLMGAGPDATRLQMQASEAELRRLDRVGALRGLDVMAFATHALLAGEIASEPALALTPGRGADDISAIDDGLLTASEAAALDLDVRWLVLSACNTAAGNEPRGEGLSGLARSFFYAGARTLIVSHFPVFDEAAPRITGETMRLARARDLDASTAMQRAMIALALDKGGDAAGASFAHPAAWAPFIVVDAS